MSNLSPPKDSKHRHFAEQFVAGIDSESAYRQAGYHPRNEGEARKGVARLLARVDVQEWMQFLIQSQQADRLPELEPRHQTFADDWLGHGNAARAYRHAGYAPESDNAAYVGASRLLARKDVQHYIRIQQRARFPFWEASPTQRLNISADKVHEELGRIAFSDWFDVGEFNGDDLLRVKQGELAKAVRVTVASVKHKKMKDGEEMEIKLHDKIAALKTLAKFYGIDLNPNELIARLRGYGYEVRELNGEGEGK